MADAGFLDAHQLVRAHQREERQGRQGQRRDMVEAMGGDPAQDRRAARAMRRGPGRERRDPLQQPATRAFAQLRHGCRWVGAAALHPRTTAVVSIGAMPSARRPTALLIAATSPGTPAAGGGTAKRKLLTNGCLWPVPRTA